MSYNLMQLRLSISKKNNFAWLFIFPIFIAIVMMVFANTQWKQSKNVVLDLSIIDLYERQSKKSTPEFDVLNISMAKTIPT